MNDDHCLGDLVAKGVIKIFTGPFGSALHKQDYLDSGVSVVPAEAIIDGELDPGKYNYVGGVKATELQRYKLNSGDIVFARRGAQACGVSALVKETDRAQIAGTGLIYIRILKEGVIDPYYLFLAVSEEKSITWLKSHAIGATMPNLNGSILASLPLSVPDFQRQLEIASHHRPLARKIRLNRQINQTLEQIAQAMFKSWFVDFDPVKAKIEAKENGKDPERAAMRAISGKTDEQLDAWLATATPDQIRELAHIAVLFPDGLVDSELGPIPNGWSVSELGHVADVVDCLHAKKPEKTEENTGNVFLQLNNISDDGLLLLDEVFYISDEDYKKWVSRMEAREGDCIITNVGRVGAVAQIPGSVKAALGRNMTGIRCKPDSYYPTFLVTLLTSPFLKSEIERRTDVGTILNALNVRNIPRLRFIHPGPKLLQTFERRVFPLQRKRELSVEENRFLSNIRDTLLPKLLSGELAPEGAQSAAEAVA